jgi:DNA-binding beta-propeller fold protein YncE
VGTGPETVAIAAGVALVGNFTDDTLTPIALATLQAGGPVALPVNPTDIAVTSSGATAYVTGGRSMVPVTVAGPLVGPPITLPGAAQGIALTPDNAVAWVALQAGDLVPVTLATRHVGRRVHLGGHPSAVVIDQR